MDARLNSSEVGVSDKRDLYGYCWHQGGAAPDGAWLIYEVKRSFDYNEESPYSVGGVVAAFPGGYGDGGGPPPHVRAEYERIIGYDRAAAQSKVFNIVELMAGDAQAFDQPCAYGRRVEGHAVYCHNSEWLYAPRKCRRTWSSGGQVRDEDCEGFKPNKDGGARD